MVRECGTSWSYSLVFCVFCVFFLNLNETLTQSKKKQPTRYTKGKRHKWELRTTRYIYQGKETCDLWRHICYSMGAAILEIVPICGKCFAYFSIKQKL